MDSNLWKYICNTSLKAETDSRYEITIDFRAFIFIGQLNNNSKSHQTQFCIHKYLIHLIFFLNYVPCFKNSSKTIDMPWSC